MEKYIVIYILQVEMEKYLPSWTLAICGVDGMSDDLTLTDKRARSNVGVEWFLYISFPG